MKKTILKNMTLLLGATLLFSGCGSDSNNETQEKQYPDLESAKKVLTFYGAASNDHYAFDIETNTLTNLNDDNKTAMLTGEEGWLFVFRDDKGDNNDSTFEDKVVMFKSDYSFENDGNATWEDFYYLNHLTSTGEMHPHDSVEFNTTDTASGKYKAMVRLNTYLQTQETLKNELSTLVTQKGTTLCNFTSVQHEDETHYFVMGTNGYVYTYDNEGSGIEFKDATLVSSAGCVAGESGMSAAEDGVIVYLKSTTKLYLVDSHEDGVSHVHSEWNLSELLPAGKSIDMMVGIVDLESDGHEH